MVDVRYDPSFKKSISKITDAMLKSRVKKQIKKILENPQVGKPMRHARKGTRELRIPPFRLSYTYHKDRDLIEFLAFYHKDGQ